MKKRRLTKTAFVFSVCLVMVWCVLGTGSSIAWFVDESPAVRNIFNIGEFDLVVSHKTETGYEEIQDGTKVFDEEALYEPGYVQVVCLKIENRGTVDFHYNLSVIPDLQTLVTPKNVYGQEIYLPEFLKFGVILAETETELEQMIATRELAEEHADEMLSTYATESLSTYATEAKTLEAGKEAFAAVIVRMPKEVGNAANYRGNIPPSVELGILVKAVQEGTTL